MCNKEVSSPYYRWCSKTVGQTNSQVSLGAGSVIAIRASSYVQLPFHFVDCSFENCEMNMNVKITEKNQLGIARVIGIFVKNAQIELEHFRFIDCIDEYCIFVQGQKRDQQYIQKIFVLT
ncbi:MAG: hypothetical protein EZS28_011317 [Streblomastix strix]|uniref:Uncharacterized protein n=1 Tax=Streblomastix strix TaxID=222440 RepID=A0A5J4WF51_9EUKA|nr:MAG: hypothetical protein EZS28_011317 [Streblomastix strix]